MTSRFWIGIAAAALAVLGLVLIVATRGGNESFALAALGILVLAGGVWAVARTRKESL